VRAAWIEEKFKNYRAVSLACIPPVGRKERRKWKDAAARTTGRGVKGGGCKNLVYVSGPPACVTSDQKGVGTEVHETSPRACGGCRGRTSKASKDILLAVVGLTWSTRRSAIEGRKGNEVETIAVGLRCVFGGRGDEGVGIVQKTPVGDVW